MLLRSGSILEDQSESVSRDEASYSSGLFSGKPIDIEWWVSAKLVFNDLILL